MRVLVTGGAGFIGGHTAARLVQLGHDVLVLDNLSTGDRANLPGGCTFVEGDVRDRELVDRSVREREVIIHLAAFTSVPESFSRGAECFEVNVHGTLNVLEASRSHGVGKVVFASSSAVYAEEPEIPKAETMCPEPASPYGVSKLEGEHVLEWYRKHCALRGAALRYFNVFGPRQAADSDYAAVIPQFIERSLLGEVLTICGDGRQTRDFVYVADVVEANVRAALDQGSGVYNVGTGNAITILSLAEWIIAMTGSGSSYRFAPRPPGDILSSTADIKQISAGLGWGPKWSLSQALQESIQWRRNQMNGGRHG